MYQGNNPCAIRSRCEIVKAFMSLLSEKDFDDIGIKEIMAQASLSRQTFYQIFDSKEEILQFYLDSIFSDFMEELKKNDVACLCDTAKVFFSFFENYRECLSLIIKKGKSAVILEKCREYLYKYNESKTILPGISDSTEREYALTFVVSGMVAMLENWLNKEEQTLSSSQMADLVCKITKRK